MSYKEDKYGCGLCLRKAKNVVILCLGKIYRVVTDVIRRSDVIGRPIYKGVSDVCTVPDARTWRLVQRLRRNLTKRNTRRAAAECGNIRDKSVAVYSCRLYGAAQAEIRSFGQNNTTRPTCNCVLSFSLMALT